MPCEHWVAIHKRTVSLREVRLIQLNSETENAAAKRAEMAEEEIRRELGAKLNAKIREIKGHRKEWKSKNKNKSYWITRINLDPKNVVR